MKSINFESTNSSSTNINSVDNCPDKVANSPSLHDCVLDEMIEPKKRYKSDPNTWRKSLNKANRLKGEAYETASGKKVPAKPMRRPTCFNNKKHKCCANIPEEKRKIIFDNFHTLDSLYKQREFFVRHITRVKPKRQVTSGTSRRGFTKTYTLTYDNEKHIVCRAFFLDTLGISDGLIKGAFKKTNKTGVMESDNSGGGDKKKI